LGPNDACAGADASRLAEPSDGASFGDRDVRDGEAPGSESPAAVVAAAALAGTTDRDASAARRSAV
jgi:hypothetical protein